MLGYCQITQTKMFTKRRWRDHLDFELDALSVDFIDSKSSHLHFFTPLPIQSAYGSNSTDFFQKSESDNTTKYLFNFGEAPSSFSLGQSPSLEAQSQSLRLRPGYSNTVWDSESLMIM